MLHRRIAGDWMIVSLALGFGLSAGCSTLGKRDAKPTTNAPASKTANPADVMPASYAEKKPPIASPTRSSQPPVSPTQLDADPLDRLFREASQACAENTCYICRLRRRENTAGKEKPEEIIIFKSREHPFSVHFKWLGEEGKGREVVFVNGKDDNKLHILTAAGDVPLTPAGRRFDLPVDSILVKSASKYPITEAGVCRIVARFGRSLDDQRRGVPGLSIKYLGTMRRPEFATPLEMVEIILPPGREPIAPQGGKRLLGFDSLTKWPVFSTTFDSSGREMDYYCFDRFQLNVRLDDDDFNPDKLWPIKKSAP